MKNYMISKKNIEKSLAIFVALSAIFLLFVSPATLPFFGETLLSNDSGHTLSLEEEGVVEELSITPQNILEDSRCPKDVQCFWEGRVVVEVILIEGETFPESRSIALGETILFNNYLITLKAVFPEKLAGQEIPESGYAFLFEVKKRNAPHEEESAIEHE